MTHAARLPGPGLSPPSQVTDRPAASPGDFASQLAAQRNGLMRFARLQLRNPTWAEDAVWRQNLRQTLPDQTESALRQQALRIANTLLQGPPLG